MSVVIPCFNSEATIARAIGSVLHQRDTDAEVIVVDDGSADQSVDVAQSFGSRIVLIVGPNRGACAARNTGLARSASEFVLFLDADDYIERDSLAAWLRHAADSDMILGPYDHETAGHRTLGRRYSDDETASSLACEWLRGRFTPPCAVLWRKSFLEKIGGWSLSALRNQDGEVALRGMLSGARVIATNYGLGVYVQHETPGRVSRRRGSAILESELSSLDNLWIIAQTGNFAPTSLAFAHAFYGIAYRAYVEHADDIGDSALTRARRMGLTGHPGSPTHTALSTVLGLKWKLRLTAFLKGRKSHVDRHMGIA